MFEAATRTLAPRMAALLPSTRFVLHEAPYATKVSHGEGFPAERIAQSEQLEALQQQLFQVLQDAFGPRLTRLAPPPEVVVADPNQRWGLAPFHYVPGYYEWLIDGLQAIPRMPGPAGPWYPPGLSHAPDVVRRPGGREALRILARAASRRARGLLPTPSHRVGVRGSSLTTVPRESGSLERPGVG